MGERLAQGNGAIALLANSLATGFALPAIGFARSYRRWSPGVVTTTAGFLCWGCVFPAGALADLLLPAANMNPELWNVPKFFVAFGMILTIGHLSMNRFWGDDSWRSAAYRQEPDLFGSHEEKTTNEDVAEAYRNRLKDVAHFKYVPRPLPMRNSSGAIIYYLFFASPNVTGGKIVEDIFERYRERGIR